MASPCTRLWRFERNTEVSLILLIYKVVYIGLSIRLVCRVCGNALEKFAVKFAKNADLDWSKSHDWWCSAIYNSVSKQGRRNFSSLYIVTCYIHIASKVCSNTCAVAMQYGDGDLLQVRCTVVALSKVIRSKNACVRREL